VEVVLDYVLNDAQQVDGLLVVDERLPLQELAESKQEGATRFEMVGAPYQPSNYAIVSVLPCSHF
jgi:hypothetical protein